MTTVTGRAVIGYENKRMMPQNALLEPGSITMEDERIPVCVNFNHYLAPVGWATDLQVNEEGEISIAYEITDPLAAHLAETDDLLRLYTLAMYITNLVEVGNRFSKKGSIVKHGRLREVSLVPLESAGSWS